MQLFKVTTLSLNMCSGRKCFVMLFHLFIKLYELRRKNKVFNDNHKYPRETECRLNFYKAFRRRPVCFVNVLYTFSLGPLSREQIVLGKITIKSWKNIIRKLYGRNVFNAISFTLFTKYFSVVPHLVLKMISNYQFHFE